MSFLRLILIAAVIWFGYRYVRKLLVSAFRPPLEHGRDDGGPEHAVFQGEMVKDPVCHAFVTRDRALSAKKDGAVYYFCSEACRSKFLAEGAPVRKEQT